MVISKAQASKGIRSLLEPSTQQYYPGQAAVYIKVRSWSCSNRDSGHAHIECGDILVSLAESKPPIRVNSFTEVVSRIIGDPEVRGKVASSV